MTGALDQVARHNCEGNTSCPPPAENYTRLAFDVAVALVCLLSLLLCGRSILRGVMLEQVGGKQSPGSVETEAGCVIDVMADCSDTFVKFPEC